MHESTFGIILSGVTVVAIAILTAIHLGDGPSAKEKQYDNLCTSIQTRLDSGQWLAERRPPSDDEDYERSLLVNLNTYCTEKR